MRKPNTDNREAWIVIYNDGSVSNLHYSRQQALLSCELERKYGCTNQIALIPISFTYGEGLVMPEPSSNIP